MKSKQKTLISLGILILHAALLYVTYNKMCSKPALKNPIEQRSIVAKTPTLQP
jgi:hypothetical protein